VTAPQAVKNRIEAFTQSRLSPGEGRLPETPSPKAHRLPKSLYSSSEAQLPATMYWSRRHGATPAHPEPVSPGPLRQASNGRAAPTSPIDSPSTVATRSLPPSLSPTLHRARARTLSLSLSLSRGLSLRACSEAPKACLGCLSIYLSVLRSFPGLRANGAGDSVTEDDNGQTGLALPLAQRCRLSLSLSLFLLLPPTAYRSAAEDNNKHN